MTGKTDSSNLKEFQDLLVTLLEQEQNPDDVIAKLKADKRFEELKGYIDSFDIDMIDVAQKLVHKWGQKG